MRPRSYDIRFFLLHISSIFFQPLLNTFREYVGTKELFTHGRQLLRTVIPAENKQKAPSGRRVSVDKGTLLQAKKSPCRSSRGILL